MADIAHTINSLWNFCASACSNRCWTIDDAETDTKHSIVAYWALLIFSCRKFILSICLLPPSLEVLFCVFLLRRCTSHTHMLALRHVRLLLPSDDSIHLVFLQSFAMGKRSSRILFPNIFCHRSGRRQTVSAITHRCEMIQNKFWVRRRQNTHEYDMTNERTKTE